MKRHLTPLMKRTLIRIGLSESRAICRFYTYVWWAPPETETYQAGEAGAPLLNVPRPVWSVGVETVSALAKRGLLVRGEGRNGDPRFTLYLTERGEEVAAKLIAKKPSDARALSAAMPAEPLGDVPTSGGAAGWRGAPLTLEGSAV